MSGVCSTALKLLACFCLLALSGVTLGQDNGPDVVKVVVEEGRDVTLPCSLSTKQNLVFKLFDWKKDQKEVFLYDAGIHYNNGRPGQDEQFKGRVRHFQDELKHGNASVIITNTKVADSGDYTCDFPHLQPRQMFHIQLVVDPIWKDRSEEKEAATAAPEPYVRTLNATEDGVLLQCEVRGAFPKPTVEWQDSAGNILPAEEPQVSERGGRHYVTLLTTVTMSGRYRCVVKQEEIHHMTAAETYMPFCEKLSEACSSKEIIGWLGGWISGVLTIVIPLGLLVATKRITMRRNKGSPPQTNGSYKPPSEMMTLQTNNVTEKESV